MQQPQVLLVDLELLDLELVQAAALGYVEHVLVREEDGVYPPPLLALSVAGGLLLCERLQEARGGGASQGGGLTAFSPFFF